MRTMSSCQLSLAHHTLDLTLPTLCSKTRGFIEYERGAAPYRDVSQRTADFQEIYTPVDEQRLATQGARCMNCGVPFCHQKGTFPFRTQSILVLAVAWFSPFPSYVSDAFIVS